VTSVTWGEIYIDIKLRMKQDSFHSGLFSKTKLGNEEQTEFSRNQYDEFILVLAPAASDTLGT